MLIHGAVRDAQQFDLAGCPPGSAEGRTHLQTSLNADGAQSFRAASRQAEDQLLREPRMLRQPGPVPASRLQHGWDDGDENVAAEVDRALRDLQGLPVDVLGQSSLPPDPDSARSPSPGLSFPSLASNSSPLLAGQGGGGHNGSEAFAALRSALHLRESNLLQPLHVGLSVAGQQADKRTPEPAHQLPDLEPPPLSRGFSEPGSPSLVELQCSHESGQRAQAPDGSISMPALTNGEAGVERAEDDVVPLASALVRQVTRSVHLSNELSCAAESLYSNRAEQICTGRRLRSPRHPQTAEACGTGCEA